MSARKIATKFSMAGCLIEENEGMKREGEKEEATGGFNEGYITPHISNIHRAASCRSLIPSPLYRHGTSMPVYA